VKKALRPIPGAKAKGSFAKKAITNVAMIEDKAVAVNTAPPFMPVWDNMDGFTARIYDIVRNVVTPARISVEIFIVAGSKLNSLFKAIFFIF